MSVTISKYGFDRRRRLGTGMIAYLAPPSFCRDELPLAVPVPNIERDIRVKIASTTEEWEQAIDLVTSNYRARGFESVGCDLRFTSHQALSDTVVLVAKEGNKVVATFSLVPDNSLIGLPLEGLYSEEIQNLRKQGRRLVETGSLAERGLSVREFIEVFIALMHLAWQYSTRLGHDTSVVAVNPRHSSFYTKLHGFVSLGPRRSYDKVQGAPAEAFYLDATLMRQRAPQMYRRIFGRPLPAEAMMARPMPANLVRHFASHSSQTNAALVAEIFRYERECRVPRR